MLYQVSMLCFILNQLFCMLVYFRGNKDRKVQEKTIVTWKAYVKLWESIKNKENDETDTLFSTFSRLITEKSFVTQMQRTLILNHSNPLAPIS